MANKQTRSTKPEERELARKRQEAERVEAELAECELRLATLLAELRSLENRYLNLVGAPYAELDELRAQMAERLAAEEPANERLQRAAKEARARANESRAAFKEKKENSPKNFCPSPKLKSAYRDAAKRIHPDLTADPKDRACRQELMAEVNRAYQENDEMRIAKILDTYEASPEAISGDGTGADLVRVIRKISLMKNRLAEIEAEMRALANSDLYLLKIQVDDAHEQNRDAIAEMALKVKQRIADCKERLQVPAAERVH
ncbi:MAG TPA: hypothetical protein VFU57_04665 [Candidatus Acidoferrales bacterium]|nr:hypothetical protein [Candidatus Acidoferrales bacterium]